MVYEKDNKYYSVCDDCGKIVEVQRQTYLKNLKKNNHYCLSCAQKGERNHQFGKSAWNKGLTKETDERVRRGAELDSKAKMGSVPWNKGYTYDELKGKEWADEFKKKSSCSKRGKPHLKKRKSSNRDKSWSYFRKLCKSLLYTTWVRPIMERDEFKCQHCGETKNLEVHHLKPFRVILLEASKKEELNLNDYKTFSDDEFERLRNAIVKMHKMEDGITLCEKCHKEMDKYRKKFDENEKSA